MLIAEKKDGDKEKVKFDKRIHIINQLLLLYPQIQPIFQELIELQEIQHGANVTTIFQELFTNLSIKYNFAPQTLEWLNKLTIGALLHDIGKVGISPEGIEKSLITMYPEKYQKQNHGFLNQNDSRSWENRIQQMLHPLMSGFLISKLGEQNYLPKQIVWLIKKFCFNHHELWPNENNPFQKTSYPRLNGNRPETALINLASLLIQLSDITSAMREDRYNGRGQLPYEAISLDLKMVLNKNAYNAVKKLFPKSFEYAEFMEIFTNLCLQAAKKIDPVINQKINPEQVNWIKEIGYAPLKLNTAENKTPILASLVKNIWQDPKLAKRLTKLMERLKSVNYTHLSRSNTILPTLAIDDKDGLLYNANY